MVLRATEGDEKSANGEDVANSRRVFSGALELVRRATAPTVASLLEYLLRQDSLNWPPFGQATHFHVAPPNRSVMTVFQ
jgi:hypothetical protein